MALSCGERIISMENSKDKSIECNVLINIERDIKKKKLKKKIARLLKKYKKLLKEDKIIYKEYSPSYFTTGFCKAKAKELRGKYKKVWIGPYLKENDLSLSQESWDFINKYRMTYNKIYVSID